MPSNLRKLIPSIPTREQSYILLLNYRKEDWFLGSDFLYSCHNRIACIQSSFIIYVYMHGWGSEDFEACLVYLEKKRDWFPEFRFFRRIRTHYCRWVLLESTLESDHPSILSTLPAKRFLNTANYSRFLSFSLVRRLPFSSTFYGSVTL